MQLVLQKITKSVKKNHKKSINFKRDILIWIIILKLYLNYERQEIFVYSYFAYFILKCVSLNYWIFI